MDLKDYWRAVRRRWRVVVACLLLAVAVAGFLTWQATPMYASSARLFVSTTTGDEQDVVQGGQFATQRVTSYADLIGTRKLAENAADLLGNEIAPDDLVTAVRAEVTPETVNIVITAEDSDARTARDIAQAYAEALSALVSTIETPEGRDTAPIKASIVDDAEVADAPVSPQPLRNLGLGAAVGLLLGLGVAVLRELTDTSITSNEDVAQVTDTPILGHLGADPASVRKEPARALSEASPWAESFRVLRTNMQYVEVDHDARVFVVSSALPEEGKSTTAANLAVSLANAGQRVVLVECDLRKPRIGSRLQLDDAVGTTSVLIGRAGVDEALQEYAGTGLRVLTSGPVPPNPSELLQSQAMTDLVEGLRARFDVVLLDAPPLLPVTDAALLAARSDGVLLVVRHGRTRADHLEHALERVDQVDAKCVGIVVTMVPPRRAAQAYGYGYGYGAGSSPSATDGRRAARGRRPRPRGGVGGLGQAR